jgi:hypothetical protein
VTGIKKESASGAYSSRCNVPYQNAVVSLSYIPQRKEEVNMKTKKEAEDGCLLGCSAVLPPSQQEPL